MAGRSIQRLHEEEGVALVTVVLLSAVLMILVAGTLTYALGSQDLARRDQDWNAALAAAEAGIDDYVYRMNEDANYWQYGNPNAVSPVLKLPTPPDGNKAFTQWVKVPGPSSSGYFRYDVLGTPDANGVVRLRATGKVGKVTRTIEASIRRRNFLDYLYFTDYETFDPALYPISGSSYTPAQAQANCVMYYFSGRKNNSNCINIVFGISDVIKGPLHTNDAIGVSTTTNNKPEFQGDTTDSWDDPAGKRWWNSQSSSAKPSFKSGDPRYAEPLAMPPTNDLLKAKAGPGRGGCLFTGPTAISLRNNGTMDVISPFTKQINCTWTKTPTTSMNNRYSLTNFTIPSNALVYVQNVPAATTDANYTNGCPYSRPAFGGANTGSSTPNRVHPLGLPQNFDLTTYDCRAGDVFLSGTLKGQLTIAAENDITVIRSTDYSTGASYLTGSDLLGLIPNNYVEVYHPVYNFQTYTGSSPPTPTVPSACSGAYQKVQTGSGSSAVHQYYCNLKVPTGLFNGTTANASTMATAVGTNPNVDPSIYAAMLTVQHQFAVQNYNLGDNGLGTLVVKGSIAQKFRGAVATASATATITGYAKDYTYDTRLKYLSPPEFLEPIATAWRIAIWAEQKPAYPA